MIKRVTLCSIAFILTYCIIYAVSYNGKREEIEQKINGLSCHNPIYVCIVVHTDADRCKGINIAVAE